MSEIEKMKRYIERTGADAANTYSISFPETIELLNKGQDGVDGAFNAICLAFNYGKAKGYRAAKAEGRTRA